MKFDRKPSRSLFENGAYDTSWNCGGSVVGPQSLGLASTTSGENVAAMCASVFAVSAAMEVMQLSETSLEAQERHAEMLLRVRRCICLAAVWLRCLVAVARAWPRREPPHVCVLLADGGRAARAENGGAH
jgi:hypothetical protein